MNRRLILTLVIGLAMLISSHGSAASPWVGTIRGGGELILSGPGNGQIQEARLHWNLKLDRDDVFNGHVSIMERLADGTKRNFRLSKHDLQTLKTSVSPGSFFRCTERSVQVVGLTEFEKIVVTFHENPNTIKYEITDLFKNEDEDGYFISSTEFAVPLDGRLTLECEASEALPEDQISDQISEDGWHTTEPRKIFLPVVSAVPGD